METSVSHRIDECESTGTGSGGTGQEGCAAKQRLGCEEQKRLANRIRSLAGSVRAQKLPLDKVASEVCRIARILETVELPLPPSPVDLVGAIDDLASALNIVGNLALAEVMAVRALKIDCNPAGEEQSHELRLARAGDIWAKMGKLADAKEAYCRAAVLAQVRLRSEGLVFVFLNRCAEIAMEAKDYGLAAVAYDRSMQMEGVNLNIFTMMNGIRDIIHKEVLVRLGHLPLKKRIRTCVEVEYDRVAKARRQGTATGD